MASLQAPRSRASAATAPVLAALALLLAFATAGDAAAAGLRHSPTPTPTPTPTADTPATKTVHPTFLFPGFGGSGLYATTVGGPKPHWYCQHDRADYRVWCSVSELAPGLRDCWEAVVTLQYSASAAPGTQYSFPHGVNVSAQGGLKGIAYVDYDSSGGGLGPSLYMGNLIAKLKASGHVEGTTLFGMPYDWRIPPMDLEHRGYYARVVGQIEAAVNATGAKAVLVAHSLGVVQVQYLLSKVVDAAWKQRYVARYAAVSGPFRGAAQLLRAVTSGDSTVGIGNFSFLPQAMFTGLMRSWGSSYTTLPATGTCKVSAPDGTLYDAADPAMFSAIGGATMESQYNSAAPVRALLQQDPGVPTACFTSTLGDASTAVGLTYHSSWTADPAVTLGPGDGTVSLASMAQCASWPSSDAHVLMNGISHRGAVMDSQPVAWIDCVASNPEAAEACAA